MPLTKVSQLLDKPPYRRRISNDHLLYLSDSPDPAQRPFTMCRVTGEDLTAGSARHVCPYQQYRQPAPGDAMGWCIETLGLGHSDHAARRIRGADVLIQFDRISSRRARNARTACHQEA